MESIFNLQGKVALITGASKGIGEAIAHIFSKAGAKVVINSRKAEDLKEVAERIQKETGQEVFPFAANAGDPQQVSILVNATIDRFGKIDILVNNAATNPVFGPSLDCDSAAFDKIMAVNVRGPFELSKLVFPSMQQQKSGSVINISSIAGQKPDAGLGMYSVSKAALDMLTKVLAKEWGKDGIRVNAIAPGLIKTKFSQALWENEAMLAKFTKFIPISRMGTPEEIASLALYLASDASQYTTGEIFAVDGGTLI